VAWDLFDFWMSGCCAHGNFQLPSHPKDGFRAQNMKGITKKTSGNCTLFEAGKIWKVPIQE